MKHYWQDIEGLNANENATPEKSNSNSDEGISLIKIVEDRGKASRRDFLKLFGFSVASATVLSSCEKPIKKAIPYLVKPENVTPGKASFYASSFYDGENYSSILVKVRDGRPIKIEGNELSKISSGSSSAITQASVLELYDDNRVQKPYKNRNEISWDAVDQEILAKLNAISDKQGKIVLLTSTIISPSTLKLIEEFKQQYPGLQHVSYDPVSLSGLIEANELSYGKAVVPNYRFNKAKVIVAYNADFLGNWLSSTEFAKAYIQGRKLTDGQKTMSRHIHFETGMSISGSNADERYPISPADEKSEVAALLNALYKKSGKAGIAPFGKSKANVDALAGELLNNKGKSLVISGSNDTEVQLMINAINALLENVGNTIDFTKAITTKAGNDSALQGFIKDVNQGNVSGALIYNSNPVYDLAEGKELAKALETLELSVSFANTWDETSMHTTYVCPDSHFLESWNDAEPKKGTFSLAQPCIQTIFNTRQFQDTLLKWSGRTINYLDYIKNNWRESLLPGASGYLNFTDFWNRSLQDGVYEGGISKATAQPVFKQQLVETSIAKASPVGNAKYTLHIYENSTIGTGKHTNNPWLQETPDSISKVCWDNFAAVSPKLAKEMDLKTGDVVTLDGNFQVPVLVQPGQAYGTLSVALGYGREKTGVAGTGVGVNVYPLIKYVGKNRQYFTPVGTITKTSSKHTLALTQTHNSMEGRPIIREATLEEYVKDQAAGNEMHEKIKHHLKTSYPEYKYEGHHWGMSVDLNSCIGCNACVVACTSENNVPVVGKTEVSRVHEMHWLRIDRYYAGDPENPEVSRQPVMCQHCDNAPCENVCPVAATTHSTEGINQMAYNRCIGTRYCNNNCPYKVRRFNWFDYNKADALPANTHDPAGMTLDLPRMVLNPDVTVRAKGVMEKCSFCVQRIQDKKLKAKIDGRPLEDGEIKTACQQACPTHAIVFGDMNNKKSELMKRMKDKRNYHLLEELHTLPSIGYMTNIRNKKKDNA